MAKKITATKTTKKVKTLHCSFCSKSQHEVRKLIAGPNVHICNECVVACVQVLADETMPRRDHDFGLWDMDRDIFDDALRHLS